MKVNPGSFQGSNVGKRLVYLSRAINRENKNASSADVHLIVDATVAFNVATAQYVKQVYNINSKQNGTKLLLLLHVLGSCTLPSCACTSQPGNEPTIQCFDMWRRHMHILFIVS